MSKTKCRSCGVDKAQSDFYEKRDKKTGRIRFDCVCIECRRKKRQSLYQKKCSDTTSSKRIIEPARAKDRVEKKTVREDSLRTRHANKLDFNDMEATYGKQITHYEKIEMVQRFNEFVAILREGYSDITGEQIFIRKN